MNSTSQSSPQTGSGMQASSLSPQQWAAILGGTALALFGLTRKTRTGVAIAAAGGYLAIKNANPSAQSEEAPAHASFAINCSPETAYQYWRDFENLPRFMRHLQSVQVTADGRTDWTAEGPMGVPIQWTAEITEDVPNQRIAWRSIPGSQLQTTGSVEFRPATAGRGTVVTAHMEYTAPAGQLGRAVAKLSGKSPEFTVKEDLRRFKAMLEAGEVATTVGQPHGPRGVHGHTEHVLFREKQNLPQPQAEPSLSRTA